MGRWWCGWSEAPTWLYDFRGGDEGGFCYGTDDAILWDGASCFFSGILATGGCRGKASPLSSCSRWRGPSSRRATPTTTRPRNTSFAGPAHTKKKNPKSTVSGTVWRFRGPWPVGPRRKGPHPDAAWKAVSRYGAASSHGEPTSFARSMRYGGTATPAPGAGCFHVLRDLDPRRGVVMYLWEL